jgi:hypothetical protein
MSCCYFLFHKITTSTKVAYTLKLYQHTKFQDPKVKGDNIAPAGCKVGVTDCKKLKI